MPSQTTPKAQYFAPSVETLFPGLCRWILNGSVFPENDTKTVLCGLIHQSYVPVVCLPCPVAGWASSVYPTGGGNFTETVYAD